MQGDGRLRTTLEEKRVSARQGWAGEKGVIFSILLGSSQSVPKEAIMCSLAVCKAQAGMCGHEKAMLSVGILAAIGLGAYFLIG